MEIELGNWDETKRKQMRQVAGRIALKSVFQGFIISVGTVLFSLSRVWIVHDLAWVIGDLFRLVTLGAFLGEWVFVSVIFAFYNINVYRRAFSNRGAV